MMVLQVYGSVDVMPITEDTQAGNLSSIWVSVQ